MIHKIDTETLASQLEKLWDAKRTNAEIGLHYGICATCDVLWANTEFLMSEWPEFSGQGGYPVKAPLSWAGPHCGRRMHQTIHDAAYWGLPRWTGEYGSSRLRLLNYMIRRIERELAKRAA